MSPLTACLVQTARTTCRCTRRPLIGARFYSATSTSTSTTPGDPEWFNKLRNEMLNRPAVSYRENVDVGTAAKLANTLATFLPAEWNRRRRPALSILPLSHSLVWFSPSMPVDQLLPDGTDPLQSPGEPWTRRMWAGGSMELNAQKYFNPEHGFTAGSDMICSERIHDVQLRGHGDSAKIFVTLHRRFAQWDSLPASSDRQAVFEQQLLGADWGHAVFTEERNLVFLKDKTAKEHEPMKPGEFVSVKYLESPGSPDFSHTLTPTRALLFRYSALTFNAHLIHLDREYARTVEGHRDLLVHGPLSLTLMLHAISGHMKKKTKNKRIVESIRYRNLAPLYCDEEMRICGALKESRINGDVYDVWIEGPTGGLAVKATVRTVPKPMFDIPKFARHSNAKSFRKSDKSTSRSEKPIAQTEPRRAVTQAPLGNGRAEELSGATSGASDIDVALGLDDSTAPSNIQQPKTSVRSRVNSVPVAVPNVKPRQTSLVMATDLDSDGTNNPAIKFSRLITPSSASEGDPQLVGSTAVGLLERTAKSVPDEFQSVPNESRFPRRQWRRIRSSRLRILKEKEKTIILDDSRKRLRHDESRAPRPRPRRVQVPRPRVLKRKQSKKAQPPQRAWRRVHVLPTQHQQVESATSDQDQAVSSSGEGIFKRAPRDRSYFSARPPSYHAPRKFLTSRSHWRSMLDKRGPRPMPKLRIAKLGATRTPPSNGSARYGLSRSNLDRYGFHE